MNGKTGVRLFAALIAACLAGAPAARGAVVLYDFETSEELAACPTVA